MSKPHMHCIADIAEPPAESRCTDTMRPAPSEPLYLCIFRVGHVERGQAHAYGTPGHSVNGNPYIDDDRTCVQCGRTPCGPVACEHCGAKQAGHFVEACGTCAKLIDMRKVGSTRVLSEHGVFCSMRCADASEPTAAPCPPRP